MAKKFFSISSVATKPDCAKCGLDTVCRSPKLSFSGDGRLNTLIIDASPSLEEDTKGKLGYGKHYIFLDTTLEDMGYDLEKDFYYTTAIGCKTARNRKPNNAELDCCRARIFRLIEKLNPRAIILLGEVPFKMIIQPRITGRLTGTPYNDFYGDRIPDQEMLRWLCPTWGIGELLECKKYDDGGISKPYYQRDVAVYNQFKKHLQSAIDLDQDVKKVDYGSMCHTTRSVDQAIDWVIEAMEWEYVAFDYETTGIRPHREGHKIWYASISNGVVAYSFPFFNNATFQKVWKKLMLSKQGKIGHNNQYEMTWTFVRGGNYWITNWIWDTMLGMHCEHNKKPTSLKYCVYREFGIAGYDGNIDEYLGVSEEEKEKYGTNAINRIAEAPVDEMLLYNAEDSLFSALLYKTQKSAMTPFQHEGALLLVETSTTLAQVSENGVIVAEDQFEVVEQMLQKEMDTYHKEIMASDEVSHWDGEEPFNYGSTKQLGHLIFDILGYKPVKKTAKGAPSLDKEAFEKLDIPFLKKIEKYREFSKMASTYIKGWQRESVNGIIHSSFKLNTVDTFRSASSEPNLQNSYKRDELKKKIVRSLVRAAPGAKIVEMDYKSLEVIINGCHSNDPSLVKYTTDASTDMHLDGTMDVFEMTKEEVKKSYRGMVKGLYIFSEFYGNYYEPIARDLWEYAQSEPELMCHLRNRGYTNLATYTLHIRQCEDTLWNDRFRVHNEWRKKQWKLYQKNGYLESYTGFRLQAPMSRNNTFNGKVQGDGFHCLCYLMNHLQKKITALGLRSYIINEIHDSLVLMVYPEEEALIDYWVWWYGTQQIREDWKWITIPLQIEKESSEIGGIWSEMHGCGYIDGGSFGRDSP